MTKLISVAGLGILELWAAIPLGIALKLHPVLNGFASGLGSISGALLVILIGDRLRNWLLKGKEPGKEKQGRIYQIWEKYGVIGLGMLSPLITGAPIGAAIGVSLGASPRPLLLWMGVGIVVWTIILVSIGTLGLSAFATLQS